MGPLRFKGLGHRGAGSCEMHAILLRVGYMLYLMAAECCFLFPLTHFVSPPC